MQYRSGENPGPGAVRHFAIYLLHSPCSTKASERALEDKEASTDVKRKSVNIRVSATGPLRTPASSRTGFDIQTVDICLNLKRVAENSGAITTRFQIRGAYPGYVQHHHCLRCDTRSTLFLDNDAIQVQ